MATSDTVTQLSRTHRNSNISPVVETVPLAAKSAAAAAAVLGGLGACRQARYSTVLQCVHQRLPESLSGSLTALDSWLAAKTASSCQRSGSLLLSVCAGQPSSPSSPGCTACNHLNPNCRAAADFVSKTGRELIMFVLRTRAIDIVQLLSYMYVCEHCS